MERHIKKWGHVLLSLAICLALSTLAGCNDDDGPGPSSSSDTSQKRLQSRISSTGETYQCEYDADGRLIKESYYAPPYGHHPGYHTVATYDYAPTQRFSRLGKCALHMHQEWSHEGTGDYDYSNRYDSYIFTDSKGRAYKILDYVWSTTHPDDEADLWEWVYDYEGDRLANIYTAYDLNSSNAYKSPYYTLSYDDKGRLAQIEDYSDRHAVITVRYTDESHPQPLANKANLMLFLEFFHVDLWGHDYLFNVNMMGKAVADLPIGWTAIRTMDNDTTRTEVGTCEWTIAEDGYPQSLRYTENVPGLPFKDVTYTFNW